MSENESQSTLDVALTDSNDDSGSSLANPEGLSFNSYTRKPSPYQSTLNLAERLSRPKPTLHALTRPKTPPKSSTRGSVQGNGPSDLVLSPLEPNILDRLRRWVVSVVIVNFDVDSGPVIQCIFPPCHFSQAERETISFLSFPDSFRYQEGSEVYTFRLQGSNSDEEEGCKSNRADQDGFIYGYAFFSRRKDESSTRGYDQRSVVILSRHPWPSLFITMVSRFGPMFLTHGVPMLESACHNIASWPIPTFGTMHELGFLGDVLRVELPGSSNDQQAMDPPSLQKKASRIHIFASLAPSSPSPLNLFAASITHIWSIWECLVLGEPIVVFGQTPAMTSQAIWWLLDVLKPIPIAGDFRPYFTIHDKDCHALVNKNLPKTGVLLGVTNPIFESMCKHWPHKLSLGQKSRHENTRAVHVPPGWQTKSHNRYISKDRNLLKRLESEIRQGEDLDFEGHLSLLLRHHFTMRAVQFLVPLNRYLNTLMPRSAIASPSNTSHGTCYFLKPFHRDRFFESLKLHGSPLPFRSAAKQKDFYARWLKSPAFGLWMARQEEIINAYLQTPSQ